MERERSSEGRQCSGPSSALGRTGRGAGARRALPAALGGRPGSAPDACGMPLPPRRASGRLSQPLAHSRTRPKRADPAGLRPTETHRRAPHRLARRLPGSLATSPGPARPAAAAAGPKPGTLLIAPRGSRPWVGAGGARRPPYLPFSHESLQGFCAAPSRRAGSVSQPAGLVAFRLLSFVFPLPSSASFLSGG